MAAALSRGLRRRLGARPLTRSRRLGGGAGGGRRRVALDDELAARVAPAVAGASAAPAALRSAAAGVAAARREVAARSPAPAPNRQPAGDPDARALRSMPAPPRPFRPAPWLRCANGGGAESPRREPPTTAQPEDSAPGQR